MLPKASPRAQIGHITMTACTAVGANRVSVNQSMVGLYFIMLKVNFSAKLTHHLGRNKFSSFLSAVLAVFHCFWAVKMRLRQHGRLFTGFLSAFFCNRKKQAAVWCHSPKMGSRCGSKCLSRLENDFALARTADEFAGGQPEIVLAKGVKLGADLKPLSVMSFLVVMPGKVALKAMRSSCFCWSHCLADMPNSSKKRR